MQAVLCRFRYIPKILSVKAKFTQKGIESLF